MTVRKIGRRFFLAGAGGAWLSIPALSSLTSDKALAQDDPPRRMVAMQTAHGGVWQEDIFPNESQASMTMDHPLHTVRRGPLSSMEQGGDRIISPALRAPASSLSESLVGKMNLMRGLDVPFYYGHARHVMGNYGGLSNNHNQTTPEQRTADQVIAYASNFYPETPRRRSLYFGYHNLSVEYRDRSRGAAGGYRSVEEASPGSIFDAVFVQPDDAGTERPPPIDAVHASYARLQSGASSAGARLGAADRERLSQYMDHLSDIQASLDAGVGSLCGDARRPDGLGGAGGLYQPRNCGIVNDIIVAAFMCDSSRVAVIGTNQEFANMGSAGYHEVAHAANSLNGNPAQLGGLMRDNNIGFFRQGFLDLVSKLDSLGEGGATMLDNSLVWWAHEAGASTHQGDSIPVLSAGSAGGAMHTGRYFDFRERESNPFREAQRRFSNLGRSRGACFFQWTTSYLDAFDIPRNEWQVDGRKAFSGMAPNPNWNGIRYDQNAMDASCDAALPGLLV